MIEPLAHLTPLIAKDPHIQHECEGLTQLPARLQQLQPLTRAPLVTLSRMLRIKAAYQP